MNLEAIGSVFELIAFTAHFARQLAGLTSRHEASTQAIRDGGANHETAGLGTHNLGNACIFEMAGDSVNGCLETFWLLQKRRDVFKNDARLGIIGNVGDVAFKIVSSHECPFSHGICN